MTVQPLAGVRILDFSRVLAGPYCTALLADIGADVLKIEQPGGDDYRHIGPFSTDGSSAVFNAVNRGKRSVVLDLNSADGKNAACALARDADVVVENFRPGVADRLGIGWKQLSAINPGLVYVSISGFGQSGPNAARPAYDVIMQAMSGIMATTGRPDGPPTLIGESIADIVSGLFASWSILAALVGRQRGQTGTYIDLAMFDAMIALQPLVTSRYLTTGEPPKRVGNRHPASAPFGVFAAKDGEFALAVLNDKLFETLAAAINQPDLATDQRFASDLSRAANEAALRAAIETWSRQRTVAATVRVLVAAGVPCAEVDDIERALASDQAQHRPPLQEVVGADGSRIRSPKQPAYFNGRPAGGNTTAPALGAHTNVVLSDITKAWLPRRETR
jgi:CoA:oxalate CoA-transferase